MHQTKEFWINLPNFTIREKEHLVDVSVFQLLKFQGSIKGL